MTDAIERRGTGAPEKGRGRGLADRRAALAADAMVGLRLVRLEGFEPAVALAEDELAGYLRRFSLLFVDDANMRRGGIGRVVRAVNAQGESFALKQLILPSADETVDADGEEDAEARAALTAKFKAAFREEYECHRALSGLKGFPRLYGWGEVEGVPAIVMEWVEGETLARLRPQLAVDAEGRLSPLTAARLGRDIFDLLCRMALVGEGFVHRDVSPANIMVRTGRIPLDRQIAEGDFDLCLIDFGSSLALEPELAATGRAKTPFTERYRTLRRATVAYAPPEMLSDDLPDLRRLRQSPSIDVYAAASVTYELMAGSLPFDELVDAGSGASGSRRKTRSVASPYRVKMDEAPARPVGAHEAAGDLARVLAAEPDVAMAAADQAQQLGLDPASPELADALAFVDAQLADILLTCLVTAQDERPSAAEVHAALSAFCENYARNVGRSLRGEALAPCPLSTSPGGARRAAGVAVAGVAVAAWLAVAASAAVLADGALVRLGFGTLAWEGRLPGIAVAAVLMVPGLAAAAVSARAPSERRGFVRGVAVLAACEVPVLVLLACTAAWQPAVIRGLAAALVATFALAWFVLALGYALAMPAEPSRRRVPAAGSLMGGAAAVRVLQQGVAGEPGSASCGPVPVGPDRPDLASSTSGRPGSGQGDSASPGPDRPGSGRPGR